MYWYIKNCCLICSSVFENMPCKIPGCIYGHIIWVNMTQPSLDHFTGTVRHHLRVFLRRLLFCLMFGGYIKMPGSVTLNIVTVPFQNPALFFSMIPGVWFSPFNFVPCVPSLFVIAVFPTHKKQSDRSWAQSACTQFLRKTENFSLSYHIETPIMAPNIVTV